MRTTRLFLCAALVAGAMATISSPADAATEDLVVSVSNGTLILTDSDFNSGYLFVVQDYKLILDSDSGAYSVGAGCQNVEQPIWHDRYDHWDYEYVVCSAWDKKNVRGTMGEGWDFIDLRDAPGPLTATFDLGPDGDYYYGSAGADIVRGGADADEIYGLGGDDELYGDGDFDMLYPGTGSDFVDGGADEDWVSYEDVPGPIDVKYTYPSGTVREGGSIDQLRNIEGINDSPANDKIVARGTPSTRVSISTSAGRDLVTSTGYLDISSQSEKGQRDRINIRNVKPGSGSRAGLTDTLDCNGVRPSSIQYDRGIDKLSNC